MAAANERLQDRAVDRAIDLRRYNLGVIRRIIATLNRSDARLTAQLSEAMMRLDRNSFTVERLDALLASVRATNVQAYSASLALLERELSQLAEAETAHQAGLLRATVPAQVQAIFPVAAVSPEQVYAAAMARPFQGRLLRDWAAAVEAGRMAQIRNAVRQGFVEGATTSEIIAEIRGTRALGYADGLLERPRRELATIVQTALAHTAQVARAQTYRANADLVKAVAWVATLDNRTTLECAERDGHLYDAESHDPLDGGPPWLGGPGALHFNCRSVDVPVLKSWRELGIDADDLSPSTRASMDGQVPADLTYAEWITRQSAERQDEILGPTRGAMLRSGTPFTKFTDDKGRTLTLAQLRERGA